MSSIPVRTHTRKTSRGWPYAVRQHIRHRWVIPETRREVPFDEVSETNDFLTAAPTIQYIDPALIALTGNPKYDRQAINAFLRHELNADSTRRIQQRLRQGLEIDPIAIIINRKGEEIMFNGAHRSVGALAAGVRRVPVEVYMEDGEPFDPKAFARWKARQKRFVLARGQMRIA